jgi:hypothetical protein
VETHETDKKASLMLAILARGQAEADAGKGIPMGPAFARLEKRLEGGKVSHIPRRALRSAGPG